MQSKIQKIINEKTPSLKREDRAILVSELSALIEDYLSVSRKEVAIVKKELKNIKSEKSSLENKIRLLNDELKSKFNKKDSKTIAFLLGNIIIQSVKNPKKGLLELPENTSYLLKESIRRRGKKNTASKIDRILGIIVDSEQEVKAQSSIKTAISSTALNPELITGNRGYINIGQRFPKISFDYIKKNWPVKNKNKKFISILDEISENSWGEEFRLFPLSSKNFSEQIATSTSDGLFLESCWKGNSGEWQNAFLSPGFQHQNAKNLVKAIDIAKNRDLPVLFWNKEDPMHYKGFLPIARKCDIIFTTDSDKIADYKRDVGIDKVYCLPFAANQLICNPMNRSRYKEENICFAGAYYSLNHEERKQQMDDLLPALLELEGVIYDRLSEVDSDRYKFPSIYKDIVRDSVNFKEMTSLYKHFKIFLNVNTITESPTMMSRRVYELLACGTPVISTPSRAIEEQFPGIVQIAKNAKEAEQIARHLLENPWEHARLAHLGYREVMLNHTYEQRKDIISLALNMPHKVYQPLVSIVLPTMRPHFIDRIVNNIGDQTYSNIECIIITQDYSKAEVAYLEAQLDLKNIKHKTIENNSSQNLGARLNQALRLSDGEFIAKFDDDDIYFPNYLTDMMIPFSFGDWSIVGKQEGFFYLEAEDKLLVKYPNSRHIDTNFVMGATFIIKKSDLIEVGGFLEASKGEDSDLLKRMQSNGKKIYAADPFNFIVWRSKDSSSHSWDIKTEFFDRNCEYVGKGLSTHITKV